MKRHMRPLEPHRLRVMMAEIVPAVSPPADHRWRDDAACLGEPTGWWYADIPTRAGPGGQARQDADLARAFELCAGCPVRHECLEHALAEEGDHGVWGGLTGDERRRLRRHRWRNTRSA